MNGLLTSQSRDSPPPPPSCAAEDQLHSGDVVDVTWSLHDDAAAAAVAGQPSEMSSTAAGSPP